ncbi:MAG: selenide, water dikinase SelD [Chitinophagales bacterium]|nr:selenide, water dikinase SelD [Chitinophagales bacterium]MCZ2392291.1 selenide, water dikinase SelD [Chitinophagales bacterium]
MEDIRLTQYSHGAGCGCKISPSVLDKILHHTSIINKDSRLIVGNQERDDAAVYDLGNGTALISTTDFFMPIVDDPFDFGRIAATNAISDVYAMGGKPILSIAILGWPIHQLAPEIAQRVLEGARSVCAKAGITLAGGHSIDSPEPIFGLAVNGLIEIKNLKRNSTATLGNKLYLTKALGVGALSTALKKGILQSDDAKIILDSMTSLNSLGEELGQMEGVKAMTDVTGFGLLGHLVEMCEASRLTAVIEFGKIPTISSLNEYLNQNCIPGGTTRNWASYGHKIGAVTERQKLILADPQTSGGLLIAVDQDFSQDFENYLAQKNIHLVSFGYLVEENNIERVKVI